MQKVDDDIIGRIYELVNEGIRSVSEMERHLQVFVKYQMFAGRSPPDETNRRFYPTRTDIRNHMYRATQAQRLSKIDQEDVQCKLEEWQREHPEDSFFFRPCTVSDVEASHVVDRSSPNDNDEDSMSDDIGEMTGSEKEFMDASKSLLFVHQTKWQKDILLRYVLQSEKLFECSNY